MASAVLTSDPRARAGSLNLDRLLRLRLVVARFGEMDNAAWWNTKGILGRLGSVALRRGFPKTHSFVQARIAFAVARHRCQDVFDPPRCMTLWKLPAEIEDEFETKWNDWLDRGDEWTEFYSKLQTLNGDDLLTAMRGLELVSAKEVVEARKLKRSAENRAVPLPGTHTPTDAVLTQLALGFFRGEPGNPAIPYARLQD